MRFQTMLFDKIDALETGRDQFRYCFGDEDEEVTRTEVNVPSQSAAEKELTERAIELANFQLTQLNQQSELQQRIFTDELQPLLDTQRQQGEQARAEVGAQAPLRDELLQLALADLRRGGAATPEEIRLIDEAGAAQLESGVSDIDRFSRLGMEQLRGELAPSLGLRPTDTPILDRGGRIAEEAIRQKGQLARDIRGFGAQARLNLPMARSQLVQSGVGNQQNLAEATRQFQAGLSQNAFLNRLNLTNQAGGFGLGLATGVQPGTSALAASLQSSRISGAPTVQSTNTSSNPGFLSFVNAGAGLATGIGSAIAASSREVKTDKRPVDENLVLEMVEDLPVETWRYKGDATFHLGTYAEDFREGFGLGDGKTLDLIDTTGALMASVKALSKKVKALESFGLAEAA